MPKLLALIPDGSCDRLHDSVELLRSIKVPSELRPQRLSDKVAFHANTDAPSRVLEQFPSNMQLLMCRPDLSAAIVSSKLICVEGVVSIYTNKKIKAATAMKTKSRYTIMVLLLILFGFLLKLFFLDLAMLDV